MIETLSEYLCKQRRHETLKGMGNDKTTFQPTVESPQFNRWFV